MRLIDADEMSRIFAHYGDGAHMYDAYDLDDMLDKMPTIDPTKYGRWIPAEKDEDGFECNQCHCLAPCHHVDGWMYLSKYCPHCGARMIRKDINRIVGSKTLDDFD